MIHAMTESVQPTADIHPAARACLICGTGRRQPGTTSITVDRGEIVITFQQVPALVCDNCADALVDVDVARELERQLATAIAAGVKVDVRQYIAGA